MGVGGVAIGEGDAAAGVEIAGYDGRVLGVRGGGIGERGAAPGVEIAGDDGAVLCDRAFGMAGDERVFVGFFYNDTASTEICTLSLHDALPILLLGQRLAGLQIISGAVG